MAANQPSSFINAALWNDFYGQAAFEVNQLQGHGNTNRLQNFDLSPTTAFPLYGSANAPACVTNQTNETTNWPTSHAAYNNSNCKQQHMAAYANGNNNFLPAQQQQQMLLAPVSLPNSASTSNDFATCPSQQSAAYSSIIPPPVSDNNVTASNQQSQKCTKQSKIANENVKQTKVNNSSGLDATTTMIPQQQRLDFGFKDTTMPVYYEHQQQQQPYTFYNTPPTNYDSHSYAAATLPLNQHRHQAHHQAQTPPESVSPKSSANTSGGVNNSSGVNAFSPHSIASNSSSLSSAAAAAQQQQLTAQRPSNKRARHGGYDANSTGLINAKQSKASESEQTYANTVPSNSSFNSATVASNPIYSHSHVHAQPATTPATSFLPAIPNQFPPPPPPSSEQDFDQFSSFGGGGAIGDGDLRSLNENPIRFQPYLPERWEPLYDQHVQPIEFTTYGVDAEKGFNYSMYDQVHVCQKKNHFQITCQFQTTAPPCFVGNPLPLDMNRARIVDIHLNMYGIKLDAPDQKVRLQQSKPDRTKQDFCPLLVKGLGETNYRQQPSENMAGDLSSSLMCHQQQYSGVRVTVGRLHFADTTMNNMRKKGKPNRSQQYFALVVELSARDVEGNARTVLSMMSDKCIVRASNPGQFESNLDVTWLKSPSGPDSIFHQGKVGINVEKPTEALEVRGNIKLIGGHVLNPSDERIKTDIQPLDPREQLANVTKMKVYKYRYKDGVTQALGLEDEHGEFHEIGFLAQEVAAIIPDAVEISGDLTLVNGETIDNLLVVNKERVFIDTVAAVGELNRVLDAVVGRLERMERTKPKTRSSLSRSDSLRSITSSVTQISNRLRMLVPQPGDELSAHYGYITANSRRVVEAQPPLNEADEDDDEEEKRSAKTTKTTVVDSDDGTLCTLERSVSQQQQKCAQALQNRLSLSSSSTRTTATFADTTWRNNLVLPSRKKPLQQSQLDSSSSVDDAKSSNFYIACRYSKFSWWLSSRFILLLAMLICIALFSGLASLAIVYYAKSASNSANSSVVSNALVYPLSSRSVLSDEELLRQYKMLPRMLTRTQVIEQCQRNSAEGVPSPASISLDDKCARQYDRLASVSEICCSMFTSNNGGGNANDLQIQREFLVGMGLINRQRKMKHLQAALSPEDESFPNTLVSVAPVSSPYYPSTVATSYFHHPPRQATPSLKPIASEMPTRESPRIIVDAPLPPPLHWRRKRRDVSGTDNNNSAASNGSTFLENHFQLTIPSLNLTLDHTYCSKFEDNGANDDDGCKPRTCLIRVPLQADFPLVMLDVTLDAAASGDNDSAAKQNKTQYDMDLCEFDYPTACNEQERVSHQQKPHTPDKHRQQKTWALPVGFYVTSSYKLVVAEGDFTSSLGGVCSLLTAEPQRAKSCSPSSSENKHSKKFSVIDVEFRRMCA